MTDTYILSLAEVNENNQVNPSTPYFARLRNWQNWAANFSSIG